MGGPTAYAHFMILYGIKNCDTVKKARKALEAAGADYRFHDFRSDGIGADQIAAWVEELGLERVLNKRGTTWRNLDEAQKEGLSEAETITLMAEHPTLIKRPVIDLGPKRLIGFSKAEQDALMEHLGG